MFIEKLRVINFRNYICQEVVFSRETNVIYGNNAQGKTNLLEALALFSSGKSYRRSSDKDLIRYGEDYTRVIVEFDVSGVKKDAEIFITSGKSKYIKLCGVNLRKTSELLGAFRCVVFSPDELLLINGAPEIRRNFTDLVLSSLKPLYYDNLKKYYKILKQKNNLLKSNSESIMDTLPVWNEKLSAVGTEIMCYRNEFIDAINPLIKNAYGEISEGKENLCIKYAPSVNCVLSDKKTIKEKLFEIMDKKMQSEIYQGVSSVGIHRDDFEFYINDKNAKSFASQGQQRSAIIALKEAEARLIFDKTGEQPVLLLDDVLSELDIKRREYILKGLNERQVIITCTEKATAKNGSKYFCVKNGILSEG